MSKKNQIPPQRQRRLLVISGIAGLLIVLSYVGLLAQQRSSATSSRGFISPGSIASSTQAEDASALLPSLPPPAMSQASSQPKGVSLIAGPIPGVPPQSADEYKNLYSYSGPYYNTTDLDGRVVVLEQSVYIWPAVAWKASGMLRNQTKDSIRVSRLSARLLGKKGQLIGTAIANLPLDQLRVGEPIPFLIQAPVSKVSVASVDWKVEYEPAQSTPHQLSFQSSKGTTSPIAPTYSLFGEITNLGTTTAREVHVVAAWLNTEGRVLYVTSPKMRVDNSTDLIDQIDIDASNYEIFAYDTSDASLAALLGSARIALWGISK